MKRLTRRTASRRARRRARRRPAPRDTDTEQRILDAAHAVFLRRGTTGARMQEIAAEARVNQALLHYYFRSKEQLARAAFERAGAELMPAVIEVIASEASVADKVARVVGIEIDLLRRTPYLPGYLIGEVTHHPDRVQQLIAAMSHGLTPDQIRPRVIGAIRRQIDAAVAAGTMRPIAPESFVVNLISLCIFPFAARPLLQAMLALDAAGFEHFIERRREDLVAFFLGALRP